MRSVMLCVFFALAVGKGGRHAGAANDFRPLAIPLYDWNYDFREPRVGTLHEVHTETPPTVAAIPAHYWEDALRHSVYLTLVRDKIDQLISKGAVISPDSKPDKFNSKEVEDYDLWDKIKSAPFDRLSDKELNTFGDVTVMAKGRLLEENDSFRFTEDERTNEKCKDESCMKGVRAIWSVKRVRQRDEEVSPGKYHYELTFSVMSQNVTKKQRKPYENSVRTFTVREQLPDAGTRIPVEKPRPHIFEPVRAQRAIWFHKNLVPNPGFQARRYQGLDRIFMSLFGDDDPKPEPPRARPPAYGPYIGSSSEQHQQKNLMAHPYKSTIYKYVRHPLPPPVVVPQQHFVDQPDNTFIISGHRHVAPSNVYKTTRPAVLPTPLSEIETKTFTNDYNNYTETSTKEAEPERSVYKTYGMPKPSPTKAINHFSDHIRPPVYSAPPGVFVTMDKKPFKPLPPLKAHSFHPKHKHRPGDFRPSPQLLDMQFSDPDSHSTVETAFRPIIPTSNNKTSHSGGSNKKTQTTNKRPPKKHGNIKAKPVTTSAPDIITVYTEDLDDVAPEWTSVVNAFTAVIAPSRPSQVNTTETSEPTEKTKNETTPIYEDEYDETTTEIPVNYSHNKKKRVITTSTTEPTTTTSLKPNRRTRPPISFPKPEKTKKHKRITTTTKSPVRQVKPTAADLTPQASSAATKPNNIWELKNKSVSVTETSNVITTVSSTTPTTTTTTRVTSTTTAKPVITTTSHSTHSTQPKNKNRFRQSTLMTKGTSVNHDKWSSINIEKEKNKTVLPPSGFPRRKASNFQGHVTSTHRSIDVDHKEEDHTDKKISMEYMSAEKLENTTTYEEAADQYNIQNQDKVIAENKKNRKETEYEWNDSDEKEYMFNLSTPTQNERTNEISDAEDPITEETFTTTPHSVPKNKTKCKKKKKHENLMTSSEHVLETTTTTYESTTTAIPTTTTDFFLNLFGDYEETTEKSKPMDELDKQGSEKNEKFAPIDDELYDYLDELKKRKQNVQDEQEYEEDDDENEATEPSFSSPFSDLSPFNNESENSANREVRTREDSEDNYDDYEEQSPSFLELMAME